MSLSTTPTGKIASERGLLPWHADQWQMLQQRHHSDTLPHALLLTGLHGLGKNRFAEALTQTLLCNRLQTDGQACQRCRACLLYQAGTHPDYLQVRPSEEGKAIVVDQIREMNGQLALTSQYAGYKIVIISPAEQMNAAAANSLLKTLEEPAARSLLILITSQPAALPATVRSRCQQIKFVPPSECVAISWLGAFLVAQQNPAHLLAVAGGAPLTARSLGASDALTRRSALFDGLEKLMKKQADPVTLAAVWLQGNVTESLTWLLSYIIDMIRLRCVDNPPYLANPDLQERLSLLAHRYNPRLMYAHLDRVAEAIRLLNRQVNVQLLLEDILISWNRTSPPNQRLN